MTSNLKQYRAKRDFTRTREPDGTAKRSGRPRASMKFVIQKHDASHLHYDFRLEMEGVLKSWAVPKEIPIAKGERRLAMEVEDHPVEYGRFEGVIPEGNYGAGTVQLWDRGKYEASADPPVDGWRKGKLDLVLHGRKLHGHWTLVRMRRADGPKNSWLLIKTGDSLPALSKPEAEKSVSSGKTLAEISRSRKVWESAGKSRPSSAGSFKDRIRAMARKRR